MVFDTSVKNRPEDWGPEGDSLGSLPPGKEGGPAVDDQAIAELALYMQAQTTDCPDDVRKRAESISEQSLDATWQLVATYASWRQSYLAEKRRRFRSVE